MKKLPFVPSIFFKTMIVVVALFALIWTVAICFMDYGEVSTADKVGTVITGFLATYLFHLWVIPVDDLPFDEPSHEDEGESEDGDVSEGEA